MPIRRIEMATVFVRLQGNMGVDPDIDDIDLGTFDSLDAAKRSVEEDEEENIVWKDTSDGGAYAELQDGEEILITPTSLRY
jgi:hypothetical protein